MITDLIKSNAYGGGYRTANFTGGGWNTWYTIPLTGGSFPCEKISHSSSSNSENVYCQKDGIYLVQYSILSVRGSFAHHLIARAIKNNTTEIVGSMTESVPCGNDSNELVTTSNSCISKLSSGDYISIQMGTNISGGFLIQTQTQSNLPTATTYICASLMLIGL